MTDKEKAIVMAYTGKCMLTGDKFQIFHKYVEDIMGRPVYTHEMAIKAVDDEIKEKSKADFIALCADESSSEKPNKWILISERLPEDGKRVMWCFKDGAIGIERYKCDAIDHFYPQQGQHGLDEAVAWMPLPTPYKASPTGAESEGSC